MYLVGMKANTISNAAVAAAAPVTGRKQASGHCTKRSAGASIEQLARLPIDSEFRKQYTPLVPATCCTRPSRVKLSADASSSKRVDSLRHAIAAASLVGAILLCAICLQGVGAADVVVSVNPSIGVNSPSCSPCATIAYAVQSRGATIVSLSAGTFIEPSIAINNSVPVVSITGLSNRTVVDCSLRPTATPGPAFIVTNTSIAISGITFRNCANFNVNSAIGGAVSASGSNVTVSNCNFFNNTAQTGGAIGVTSGSLVVASSVFQYNTATCPNATLTATSCSAWGGAIGTVEALSVSLIGNNFSSNAVNLVLNGVNSATSQAAGGGGCISVMYTSSVSARLFVVDKNILQYCVVQMSGSNNISGVSYGIQYGNTYGGAVSLYYGLDKFTFLNIMNVTSKFTSNICQNSGILSSVGIAGNAYGGCFSVYAGALQVNALGDSAIGSLYVDGVQINVSSNSIVNCSAAGTNSAIQGGPSSGNIYGGAISVYIGHYSLAAKDISENGTSIVTNIIYVISSNNIANCSATFSALGGIGSFGANVYGGGISLLVGAYLYSISGGISSSSFSGGTMVSNATYTISSNTLTSCSASSVISARGNSGGMSVHGGGMSLMLGVYAYNRGNIGNSSVSGSTHVFKANYDVINNTLTGCSASVSSNSFAISGANAFGGCLSLLVGAYSYSYSGSSGISGNCTVNHSTYAFSENTLSKCFVSVSSSNQFSNAVSTGNLYGGGMSFFVGSYSYSHGGNSHVSGSSMVKNSTYTISKNILSECYSSTYGFWSGNLYGGGMSVLMGAYSCSYNGNSYVFGCSTVTNSAVAILGNTVSKCSVLGDGNSNGGNVYGGGMSVLMGAYSFSCYGNSGVFGSSLVDKTSNTVTNNTLISCRASNADSYRGAMVPKFGNVYGGGVSLLVGSYSSIDSTADGVFSSFSGSTNVSHSSYSITANTLQHCSATCNLANVYGGGVSVMFGACSISFSAQGGTNDGGKISSTSGSTTAGNTGVAIVGNILNFCSVLRSANFFNYDYRGGNSYGGGISLCMGSFSYAQSLRTSSVLFTSASSSADKSAISNGEYMISFNRLLACTSTSKSTMGDVFGGGISLMVGSYSFCSSAVRGSRGVASDSFVFDTKYSITDNLLTRCSSIMYDSGRELTSVAVANVHGGGISLHVGPYSLVYGFPDSSSAQSGSSTVDHTRHIISRNTLMNCTAMSFSGSDSKCANVSGGGISVHVGAFAYFFVEKSQTPVCAPYQVSASGGTIIDSSYLIASNSLTGCSATSVSQGSSSGANVYGGGISLQIGSYGGGYSAGCFYKQMGISILNSSYSIIDSNLTSCFASSNTLGSSLGANVYGGGISWYVGPYYYYFTPYSSFSNVSLVLAASIFSSCFATTFTGAVSNGAASFGGAVSFVQQRVESSVASSSLNMAANIFYNCSLESSSAFCIGSSSCAGGAFFASVASVVVDIVSCSFVNSHVSVNCATSSINAYSIGGAVSIVTASTVSVAFSKVINCLAKGVRQATNVLVSGGGIHVQAADLFVLQNCSISSCGVQNAFSTFLQSGGGAIGTQNVSAVRIFGSNIRDSSDSSFTGIILLQQPAAGGPMIVSIDQSIVTVQPSMTPALYVSCGFNCTLSNQQRIRITLTNSRFEASYSPESQFALSAVMSLPRWSPVLAEHSYLSCNFKGFNDLAVLASLSDQALLFTCASCLRPFEIAMTSSLLDMKDLSSTVGELQCRSLGSSLQQCPFGVDFCSTVVKITVGFWSTFNADGSMTTATRCPPNYCGCQNILGYNSTSCQLSPPFSPESLLFSDDALCNANRRGVLCGGCKQGFTQSLDGYSCVSNESCLQNMGWTWAVTIIGYMIYSGYIVVSSLQADDGLIMCVLFYGQMSLFASVAGTAGTQRSGISAWFARVAHLESITSFYSETCYGTNMSAYTVTAAQLSGPALVLVFATALTLVLKRTLPFLQRCNIDVVVSIPATLSVVILLLFSSVTTVVFKLITCAKISNDPNDDVVFIDGTVKCRDGKWKGLIAVVALLCLFPLVFAAALRWKRLPHNVRAAVCSAYSQSRFYWGAVTLFFRVLMSIMFATLREFPSTAALLQSFLCVTMLILLTYLKPYRLATTHHLDVMCYATLIMQFVLEIFVRSSDSLGVSPGINNPFSGIANAAVEVSSALRYDHLPPRASCCS
jgi:hypothetical protein